MATPMTLPDVCCLCYGEHPLDGGTFDLIDEIQGVIRMALVNVCHACRIAETGQRIMKQAAW